MKLLVILSINYLLKFFQKYKMYFIKIKVKNKDKISIQVFRNYIKVDQLSKIYKNHKQKSMIVNFSSTKFKKYIKRGLNFYNKKK